MTLAVPEPSANVSVFQNAPLAEVTTNESGVVEGVVLPPGADVPPVGPPPALELLLPPAPPVFPVVPPVVLPPAPPVPPPLLDPPAPPVLPPVEPALPPVDPALGPDELWSLDEPPLGVADEPPSLLDDPPLLDEPPLGLLEEPLPELPPEEFVPLLPPPEPPCGLELPPELQAANKNAKQRLVIDIRCLFIVQPR